MSSLLHVVLCYIEYEGRVLLLRRVNDPYAGYFALPGGKVNTGESVLSAAVREAEEESGLTFSVAEIIGDASEKIVCLNSLEALYEYNMTLVRLQPDCFDHMSSVEGELSWLDYKTFMNHDLIVPSDIDLVERFIVAKFLGKVHYRVGFSAEDGYRILNIRNL